VSGAPLPGTEDHPHARMTLGAALASGASHAYLFHGPAGVGKSAVARAFAGELLASGATDPDGVRTRVANGTHPDLTWVRPTGAHVMRTEDVDGPVVNAATRTPFEASRRVFVLERVDTMNDEVANRLLKTLEEPAPYAHLILLSDSLGRVLPTVVSRCQLIRFDGLPAARIAAVLEADGVPATLASACARLSLGNGERARYLASEAGVALRGDVDGLLAAALTGRGRDVDDLEPWRNLLARAEEHRSEAEGRVAEAREERLRGEPAGRERGALERQFEDAAKREARRSRTELLDLGLRLAALGFRDLTCIAEGVPEAALDPDRDVLGAVARERDTRHLRLAVEHCEAARLALERNVTEDLALEALSHRLAGLLGTGAQ